MGPTFVTTRRPPTSKVTTQAEPTFAPTAGARSGDHTHLAADPALAPASGVAAASFADRCCVIGAAGDGLVQPAVGAGFGVVAVRARPTQPAGLGACQRATDHAAADAGRAGQPA